MAKIELDEFKVYLFYLKHTKQLYAFTTEKDIKKTFLEERNKDCFYIKTIEMNELDLSIFMNKYRQLKLEQIPIDVSIDKTVMMYATPQEESIIEETHSQLCNSINSIWEKLRSIDYTNKSFMHQLKEKYKKAIDYLCRTDRNVTLRDGSTMVLSSVNIIYLYTKLFKDTYSLNYEEEEE